MELSVHEIYSMTEELIREGFVIPARKRKGAHIFVPAKENKIRLPFRL